MLEEDDRTRRVFGFVAAVRDSLEAEDEAIVRLDGVFFAWVAFAGYQLTLKKQNFGMIFMLFHLSAISKTIKSYSITYKPVGVKYMWGSGSWSWSWNWGSGGGGEISSACITISLKHGP